MKRLAPLTLIFALLLAATAASASVEQVGDGYEFRLDTTTWTDRPSRVFVAGSFNGWNATATPLGDADGDNVWTATVAGFSPGTYSYKFVVDGDRWITDPTGDKSLEVDDNYGGKNSGFLAGPDVRRAPPPEPNAINAEFVRHDPATDVNPAADEVATFKVRSLAGDVEEARIVLFRPRQNGRFAAYPLPIKTKTTEAGYDSWSTPMPLAGFGDSVSYYFELVDGDVTLRVLPSGKVVAGDQAVTPEQVYSARVPRFDVPAWAKHAVWYQIFPDRFRNGDSSNDPGKYGDYERLVAWNGEWFKPQTGESGGAENFYEGEGDVWMRRYGGDIQGVREKLPYLRDLGVTAIYLNPIFEAESMHKYDTADFRHVDDNFGVVHHGATEGTEAGVEEDHGVYPYAVEGETDDPATWKFSASDRLFLDFVKEAHEQGFHVVIDGVFNHVGTAHYAFQDVLKNGRDSVYADWFEITDWGDGTPGSIKYAAWDKPNGALPVFKKDAELGLAKGPREHIFAITKRWLDPDGDPNTRDGVDGWRLDVPGDIPHPFWRDWRKVVKAANPEAYIVGEVWSPAQAWLQGDQFDAVMNYQFAMAAQDFFVDNATATTPGAFADRLEELVTMYPRPIALAQQNLFDSHDTDRLASMFVNPDRPYDGANRLQDNSLSFNGPPYSPREPSDREWAKLVQAVQFQHAFLGAPMTYYGNEAGMWSPDDPSNRQPLPWPDRGPYPGGSEFNDDVFAAFRHAKAVRNTLPALREGDYKTVMADDDAGTLAFARGEGEDAVYVALNRSGETRRVTLNVPEGAYADYLDSDAKLVEPTDAKARATVEPAGAYDAKNGTLTLTLRPYQTVVLGSVR